MNLEARKLEFIQEFLKVQSEDVISKLEHILHLRKDKSLFQPMTVEEFNNRIDQSMEDSKNGKVIKSSDLKAKIQKWT